MYELIYLDSNTEYNEVEAEIQQAFPALVIKDASDIVHEYRLAVEGEVDKNEFYKWAMQNGLFMCLLGGQLMLMQDIKRVKTLMQEAGLI